MTSHPEDIDCRGALDRLYEYLDGELTAENEQAVRDHLAACAPCFQLFNFEDTFLKFLEVRARAQGAPPELQRRILDSLFSGDAPPP